MARTFDGVYIHDPDMAYPAVDTQHMVMRDRKHEYRYDSSFMYRLKGFPYNVYKFAFKVLMIIVAQPVCAVRYALKIKGKENIKKYRSAAGKKGMISVCNHTAEWDSLFVTCARYFSFAEYPIWQEGAESSSGMMYRLAGGIVMPRESIHGIGFSYRCMEDVVKEGKWLHVFPEAACWPFYPAIRSFRSGTFRIVVKNRMPVLPMAVKYREPRGIYKLFKKHPNAELRIGEPVVPDYSLPEKEAIEDMCRRTRFAVINLLGIENEEENAAVRNSFRTY